MTTTYIATGDNHRTIDTDTDLPALHARVQARANADNQSGATPHYVITPWTDGVEAGWRDEIHVYADRADGTTAPASTPLPTPEYDEDIMGTAADQPEPLNEYAGEDEGSRTCTACGGYGSTDAHFYSYCCCAPTVERSYRDR